MTEQEIERCLERLATCKATDVMNFDYAGTLAYIKRLKAENAALHAELEDYKIEERRAERVSKYRREDARRVADKIARCCLAHCGHKVRIEAQDGFWIETCTYPPYHGKWIVEIEKCPKEEAQKSAEARLSELKGERSEEEY